MVVCAGAGVSAQSNRRPSAPGFNQERALFPVDFSGSGNLDIAKEITEVARGRIETLADVRQEQLSKRGPIHEDPNSKHWLLNSTPFEAVIAIATIVNAVQIGLAVDYTDGDWPTLWIISEHIFTAIFFTEMVLKLYVNQLRYFQDRWNLLDFFLVVPAVIDNWIMVFIVSGDGGLGDLTILRILRLARFVRMFRMARFMGELANLIGALLFSLRTMFWAYLLLVLLVYMFALVCVEFIGRDTAYPGRSEVDDILVRDSEEWNNYQFFGTVTRSMYTLFGIITLSEFSTTTRPVFERQPICVTILIIFTCLSAFGIMNVVVGLMVQQALEVSHSLEKEKDQLALLQKVERVRMIKRILDSLDQDGNADITLDELKQGMIDNEELTELLVQVDLPPNITIEEVFTLIDSSGDGHVTPDEFQSQLLRMVDCTQFQQTCVIQVGLNQVKGMLHEVLRALGKEPAPADDPAAFIRSDTSDLAKAIDELKDEFRDSMSKMRSDVLAQNELLNQSLLLSTRRAEALMQQGSSPNHEREDGAPARDSSKMLFPPDRIHGQGWEELPSNKNLVRFDQSAAAGRQTSDRVHAAHSDANKGSSSELFSNGVQNDVNARENYFSKNNSFLNVCSIPVRHHRHE